MSAGTAIEPQNTNWKTQTLVAGAVLGALVGLSAAYLLSQRVEKEGEALEMSAGEGVKLGLLVLGLLREITNLGERGEAKGRKSRRR